jgi:EpsD family peptidyl-prolyl cis-trans isomerase
MPIKTLRLPLLAMLSASLLVAGCGDKKPATQVAAKVNKEEISVSQINGALGRLGNVPSDRAKQAAREVLDKLIDQDLLVQKAMDKKLDRDPNVMQALEAGRRQILAEAYLQKLVGSVAKPSGDDVKVYYDQHPELFAQRRIYRLQELTVAGGKELLPDLQEKVGKAKNLGDVAEWLKEKNIRFAGDVATKAAEQLPMELVPKFAQMKDGQTAVIPGDKAMMLVQLVASQSAPIDLHGASPAIEQYLTNQRRNDLVSKEVKDLRANAKIEYVGDFAKDEATLAAEAKTAADATAKAQAEADAKAKALAEAKAKADAEADAKAKAEVLAKVQAEAKADALAAKAKPDATGGIALGKDALSKGLSGLH